MSILANKAMWLATFLVLCVGLAVGVVLGSTIKDADAAKSKQLKIWAVVESNGLVDSYKGLTGNQRLDTGRYQISFDRNISKCAYTATIAAGEFGDISTFNSGSAAPQSILVFTTDNQGADFEDKPFDLVVNC